VHPPCMRAREQRVVASRGLTIARPSCVTAVVFSPIATSGCHEHVACFKMSQTPRLVLPDALCVLSFCGGLTVVF
jgi:hypothetical protein